MAHFQAAVFLKGKSSGTALSGMYIEELTTNVCVSKAYSRIAES
jgi:hypothetical protein